jgi:exopolyphosphatase/guanosine-5'-triphosphate,3'-diphosphate pyrophosphatase
MEKGRGDLIVPGLHIVLEIMSRLGKDCLTASDFGLLEGVALTQAETTP